MGELFNMLSHFLNVYVKHKDVREVMAGVWNRAYGTSEPNVKKVKVSLCLTIKKTP